MEQSTPDSNIEHDKIIENGDEVEEIEDQQINEEQSESDSDDELNAKLIQSKVAMGDDFDLSKVFDHEDSPIAYQPGGNQIKFIIMLLFFSIYLIVNSMSTIRTSDGHQLSSSIRSTFENLPIDTTSLRYTDIIDKKYVRLFFTNILIPQIYEELGKEYPAMVDGYHYINNYNYFAGMRLTHNRVILDYKKHNGFYDDVRKRNYVGRTNIKFKNIHTDVFDLYETEYSGSGGYADKGGYIYFLKDNLTYDEAIQFADDAYNNYMFDDEYLTLTFELMFYNQNLQTGCIVSYEFLNNNAAMVEKHVIVSTFFVSRYSEHNKILSPSTRLFMII